MPKDSDIIREMWVKGDLKEQLGIPHRRNGQKGRDLEFEPMFHNPHARSVSEMSNWQEIVYEPTFNSSPNGIGTPSTAERNLDTPPQNSPYVAAQAYATMSEDAFHGDRSQLLSPAGGSSSSMRAFTVDSSHSYYSVNDIPPPSPQASPRFASPRDLYPQPSPSPNLSVAGADPSHSHPARSSLLEIPANAYEMRVRGTPQENHYTNPAPQPQSHTNSQPPEPGTEVRGPEANPSGDGNEPEADWRSSTNSYAGPKAL